jgi:hypothetical protein
MVLLAPLLATLGTLPDILDDDVGRHFPIAGWGWVKLGRLIADSVLSVHAAQLISGVLYSADRCLERPY